MLNFCNKVFNPLIFLLILFVGFGCADEPQPKVREVYVIGATSIDGVQKGIYWKNGEPINLPSPHDSYPTDIFVTDNDTYISFQEQIHIGDQKYTVFQKGSYFKNGNQFPLESGQEKTFAGSIAVANGDVYVGGRYGDLGAIWKNGTLKTVLDTGAVKKIIINNGDIYYGILYTKSVPPPAYLDSIDCNCEEGWGFFEDYIVIGKNGERIAKWKGHFNDMFVFGKDVYVVGNDSNQYNAILWKNGERKELSISFYSSAFSVFVSKQDVYVSGLYEGSPVFWKNGVITELKGLSTFSSSISVIDNDVYIAARPSGTFLGTVIWKNGEISTVDGFGVPLNILVLDK